MLSVEKTLKQEIEQWKHEYEVLDACCELAQGKIAELKAENERLKQGNKELAHYLACMTEQRNKANTCLQEIKAIAESPRECILSEVSCCNICERLDKISHIITKAEEE